MAPTYILGTGLSHDGASCLLKDGRIVVAIEKERLTRRKHDGGNDTDTIAYCLDAEGITLADVELVVQNANFSMFDRGHHWFRGPRAVADHPNVVTISHHLAHAYSGIGACGLEDAAVLVVDGCGNAFDECIDLDGATIGEAPPPGIEHLFFEKDSFYRFTGEGVQNVYKDFSSWGYELREYPLCPKTTKHSIGGVYGAASVYALFGMDDPGKLMGLAPFGTAGAYDFPIFDVTGGRVMVRYDWMPRFTKPTRRYEDFIRGFDHYADLAWWVQQEVERALVALVQARMAMVDTKSLVYAGGVALNAVANRRIQQECELEHFYIQPAAGDNGLALGCAYYGWLELLGKRRVLHDGGTCFGRVYADTAIVEALEAAKDDLTWRRHDDVVQTSAEALANGELVGWFQGGSEFGPRALGNRSILADPRAPDVKDTINRTIKFREDFRPFAPSVTEEAAQQWFDCAAPSPYMIMVAPVRPERAETIASVVHADGTCRIQTVNQAFDPRYHALLSRFGAVTGVPILLNTSFNRRGMPIVETPAEAVAMFVSCPLDLLVLGDYVVRKRDVPDPRTAADLPEIMRRLGDALSRKRWQAEQIGGCYALTIAGATWTIDGADVREGPPSGPHARLALTEATLRALLADPEGAMDRFCASGEVVITGDLRAAFTFPKLLAVAGTR